MVDETAVWAPNFAPPLAIPPSVEIPDLCGVLGMPIGAARIPVLFQSCKLYQLDAEHVDELVIPEPSVSFRNMLERHPQPTRERMVLAYILARSAWRQYYQCEWIMSRWRAGSIHFV